MSGEAALSHDIVKDVFGSNNRLLILQRQQTFLGCYLRLCLCTLQSSVIGMDWSEWT